MKRTVLPILSLTFVVVFTAMFGIASCAQPTSPNDCQVVNGVLVCKPGFVSHADCTIINGSQVCKPG